MLAVVAQTSAADPVTGVLGAVDATATRQLDVVAHATTAVPLPATSPAAQPSADVAQSVAAVPQTVAGAGDAVRPGASGGSGASEQPHASDPGESSTRRGSSDARQPSPPPSLLAVATRVGRVVATPTPAAGERAAIVPAARRIVSSRVDRVASTLAYAEHHAPATSALTGRASRVAGALLGAVADVATSARDTLAAIPVPAVASLLPATLAPNLTTLLPTGAGAGASGAQPSVDPTVLAASVAAIASAQAAPSNVGPLGMPPMQRLTTQHEASADARRGAYGAHHTTLPVTSVTTLSATSDAKAPAASPLSGAAVPAPSPNGFAPASSASVGGGVSAATFLALAALLLLAAPRALRRLRLNADSWRLSQFSLIPARPG